MKRYSELSKEETRTMQTALRDHRYVEVGIMQPNGSLKWYPRAYPTMQYRENAYYRYGGVNAQ